MAKTAKIRIKEQILAFKETSQHSHYDFLKVGYNTSLYTKNHEYSRFFKWLAWKAQKWVLRLSNSNIFTKNADNL